MLSLLLIVASATSANSIFAAPTVPASGFGGAVEAQARQCGLGATELKWRGVAVDIQPKTEAEKAELERRVKEMLVKSGFSPDAAKSPISSAFARKLLTTHYVVELTALAETESDGRFACVTGWLKGQGFTDASPELVALYREQVKR